MNEGLNGKSWIWPLFGRTVSIAFLTLDHKSKYRLRSSLGTATSHFWHKSKWSLTDLRCGTDLSTKTQNSKNNFTHMSRQPKSHFRAKAFQSLRILAILSVHNFKDRFFDYFNFLIYLSWAFITWENRTYYELNDLEGNLQIS